MAEDSTPLDYLPAVVKIIFFATSLSFIGAPAKKESRQERNLRYLVGGVDISSQHLQNLVGHGVIALKILCP